MITQSIHTRILIYIPYEGVYLHSAFTTKLDNFRQANERKTNTQRWVIYLRAGIHTEWEYTLAITTRTHDMTRWLPAYSTTFPCIAFPLASLNFILQQREMQKNVYINFMLCQRGRREGCSYRFCSEVMTWAYWMPCLKWSINYWFTRRAR